MKGYKPETIVECKRMFVQEGLSALEISKHFHKMPTAQTILNWAKKEGWEEEKKNFRDSQYEKLSPRGIAEKILEKIDRILQIDSKQFTTKDADSLAKLQAALQRITDRKYQLPMLFQLLTDFIEFLKGNYSHLITPDFVKAIREFKEKLKDTMQ